MQTNAEKRKFFLFIITRRVFCVFTLLYSGICEKVTFGSIEKNGKMLTAGSCATGCVRVLATSDKTCSLFSHLCSSADDSFTSGSGMGAYAGAARRRVHLAPVLLRPPSGHRPGRRQARHARILQIGLHLTQPRSAWAPPRHGQAPRISTKKNPMGGILRRESRTFQQPNLPTAPDPTMSLAFGTDGAHYSQCMFASVRRLPHELRTF